MIEVSIVAGHLIFLGVLLFVFGLLQGVLIPFAKNSRMALSGHLTAVQCGLALVVFGLIWSWVKLSPFLLYVASYGSAAGYFLIWLGITIASLTGASKTLPIAGEGYVGTDISETVVKILEICGVVLSLISGVLLLKGLFHLLVG